MTVKSIARGHADIQKIERLNDEAFPADERVAIHNLLDLAEAGLLELDAMYDEGGFVGFYAVIVHEKCAYVFFLAIDGKLRSKGYGRQALAAIRQKYSDRLIMLDVEPIDDSALNSEQRIKRKQFYLNNGYRETGYLLDFRGLPFEVLCTNGEFDNDGLISLVKAVKPEMDKFTPQNFATSTYAVGRVRD